MPETIEHTTGPRRLGRAPRGKLALVAAGLLALGGAAGAVVTAETRPSVTMAPATPVAIRSLSSTGIVTIRGRVAEVYGNAFILADDSGRMLVDTGPEGDRRTLVAPGTPVTVQGRFERGIVHAAFLVEPDNTVLALGPLSGPPPRPHGPMGAPDRGPGAPPPPPPPGAGDTVPPPPADAPDAPPPAAAPAAR